MISMTPTRGRWYSVWELMRKLLVSRFGFLYSEETWWWYDYVMDLHTLNTFGQPIFKGKHALINEFSGVEFNHLFVCNSVVGITNGPHCKSVCKPLLAQGLHLLVVLPLYDTYILVVYRLDMLRLWCESLSPRLYLLTPTGGIYGAIKQCLWPRQLTEL